MAATIKIKNSSTAGAAPTSSDLVQGELAVNVTDKRLFTENSGGTVVELGTNPSSITLPDGSASAPTLLHSGDTNTGLFFPAADTIALTTGGTERLRLDSSGNLGLGVTPSAWGSSFKALQMSYATMMNASSGGYYGANFYYNSSNNPIYVNNGYALAYSAYSAGGAHLWLTAPSGTAGGAITWTQAMTLDASGNLGVGTTSPTQKLTVYETALITAPAGGVSQLLFGDNASDSAGRLFYNHGNDNLQFFVNSAEAARIDSSGNLLVGTTSQYDVAKVSIPVTGGSTEAIGIKNTNTTGCTNIVFLNSSNTGIGSISSTTTTTTYNTASDYRLKENIAPMTGALAKVAALKPVTYSWKLDGSDGEGFIAHELAEVCPHAVTGAKDAVDEHGNPKYQGIDTSFLVATLTAAIQEQQALIASQSEIITQLQADVAALKGQA